MTDVFFNPSCSKCRSVSGLLQEHGIDANYLRYLDQTPSRDELEKVLGMLGSDDPREMMRTNEPIYKELGLSTASRDELFDAMLEHPILIQRPIVINGGRAVIARPPEKALELFER